MYWMLWWNSSNASHSENTRIKTTHHVSDIELYRQRVDNCNIGRTCVMLYPKHYKQVQVVVVNKIQSKLGFFVASMC